MVQRGSDILLLGVGNPFESIYLSIYLVKFYFPIYIYFDFFACITTHLHNRFEPNPPKGFQRCPVADPDHAAAPLGAAPGFENGVVPDRPQNGAGEQCFFFCKKMSFALKASRPRII